VEAVESRMFPVRHFIEILHNLKAKILLNVTKIVKDVPRIGIIDKQYNVYFYILRWKL
jgi:hypothetical protein